MNANQHMRNWGVIRSSRTVKLQHLAPNFDNSQAHKANPGSYYSSDMLAAFRDTYGLTQADRDALCFLLSICEGLRICRKRLSSGVSL